MVMTVAAVSVVLAITVAVMFLLVITVMTPSKK